VRYLEIINIALSWGSPLPLSMRTLLLVEDDDAIRSSLAEGLGMAGYRVIAVPTSTEALSELKSDGVIDLAIIDIQMPPGHPHGFALARMARFHRPDLPLVLMSGYPDLAEADEPPQGSRVFLKPVRVRELLEIVEAGMAAEP
jgi:DNA-binding NtrC family response regulator